MPPRVTRESAYVALVPDRLDPSLSEEHDAFEWVQLGPALDRVRFAGFKRALELAARVTA